MNEDFKIEQIKRAIIALDLAPNSLLVVAQIAGQEFDKKIKDTQNILKGGFHGWNDANGCDDRHNRENKKIKPQEKPRLCLSGKLHRVPGRVSKRLAASKKD